MEIGNHISKYRKQKNLSQEELAEKIYVSRQTVSNWERHKNYPDIQSLLMLATLFEVSLDELVKGDLEEMEKEIEQSKIQTFNRYGVVLTILMMLMILSAMPLAYFWDWIGFGIWAIIALVTLWVAFRVEKLKKQNDIQTYKEIEAFMNGKTLDHKNKIIEQAKAPYQKILLAIGSAFIALLVCALMMSLLKFIG